jgi:hypothetical protein
MSWLAEPYISGNDVINFSPGLIYASNSSMVFIEGANNHFFSKLTGIMFNSDNINVANITTTLTVVTSGLDNGTNITCVTYRGVTKSQSSSILYFADVPHWIKASITYQEREAYFTAVLELGDMFDGGGVPIDHYMIQVDNGTQFETPGPTYSFDNTTVSVNISAHNCAGYSDFFPLEIQYNQGGVFL